MLPVLSQKFQLVPAKRFFGAFLAFSLLQSAVPETIHADEAERFKDTEIRVIRPRYFNKSKRFELGANLTAIMNESFIYTFMVGGNATFHLNEDWAIEGALAYGLNLDREDKRVLFDEFDIKTQIFRTQFQGELALQWTPVYGKWQLPSGKLVYFDTFLTVGGGMTGIDWRYDDFCEAPTGADAEPLPSNQTKSYPTFMVGAGQRYFVSKTQAYRFDIKFHRFLYNEIDGECSPIKAAESGAFASSAPHDVITLLLGVSRFF